ncbi:MAG TPA: prenyltransferase/squalene oxidase repeat-containing protein [Pirellulales bacterium]|nr:prenyltransferase/squalene oxidase repeat-containing protein [Pirellulales bacterium]
MKTSKPSRANPRLPRADFRLGAALALLLPCIATQPVRAESPQSEQRVVEQVRGAIDRAMDYLAAQQPPDGGWHHENQAPNALAILAFLGRGHVPGRGPYKDVVERGKNFVLAGQHPNGLFASLRPSHGPMYEHALATLACAELYGMDPDPKLEEALRKAVALIVSAQAPSGGWRYQPQPNDADLSVSVMQIVALRAASNAEIPLPDKTIERAIDYVKSCAHANGGFGYQTGGGPKPEMSAAGVLSLQLLGRYEDPSVVKSLDYLAPQKVKWEGGSVQYFYYFHYYAMQAHYQAGGKYWNDWHPQIRELLLRRQNADGSWDVPAGTSENEGVVGRNKIYWTAMASLVLEVYLHYLPAYQR